MSVCNISIWASGSGSNAEAIVKYFQGSKNVVIKHILTNNPQAFVIERMKKLNIKCIIIEKKNIKDGVFLYNLMQDDQINLIVLAGYLKMIPAFLVNSYYHKIINIHPSLLPKYGGKGMYGMNVHETVLKNNEMFSGFTIHYVSEEYDEGDIIFSKEINIENIQTATELQKKINSLELEYFPKIIEEVINKNNLF